MSAHWMLRRLAPALFVLVALASCSETTPTSSEPFAAQTSLLRGGNDRDDDRDSDDRDSDRKNAGIRLIRERSPFDLPGTSLSSIISVDGGVLKLGGHTVIVPPGAVRVPTLFTLSLPLDPYVNVELLATVNTLLGVVNVGEKGFRKPIFVALTYSRATNVTDASDLFIVHVRNSGKYERMPSSVDQDNKLVWATLKHFSKYCMASD